VGTGTDVSSGALVAAAKMNLKLESVTAADLPAGIQPATENKAGSDCTGSSGDPNRVLTLTNTSTSSNELVVVDGTVLRKTTNYTVTHKSASSTITFLGNIFDAMTIDVRYYT